jgi:hypothetical protein
MNLSKVLQKGSELTADRAEFSPLINIDNVYVFKDCDG